MQEKVVLIGGGGHAKVIIDAVKSSKKFKIVGIIDPSLSVKTYILGIKVIGADDVLPDLFKKGVKNAFIAIGSIGSCDIRKKIYIKLKNIGFQIPVIVHPKAVIANDVEPKEGTFIAAGAVINPGVKIGKNAIINTSSSVDHDCDIGDFVHIAPGATLSGGVKVGDETHIGTGACVIQGLNVGRKCMVKAGVLVLKNVKDGTKI